MADKRISQLVDRGTVANNDVVPIVVSGATTTNKATISSIQTFMQGNLDLGVTSVGITLGSSGTDVSVTGSPITSSGNITINIPDASTSARGVVTTGAQNFAGNKSFQNTIFANAGVRLDQNGTALPTFVQNISGTGLSTTGANGLGFNNSNNFFFAGSDKGCAVFEVNNTGTRNYTLQNASGTLAFTSDLTGFVTLNTAQTITAQKTFTTSGSSDTMIISHGSGSGFALDVLKAGNGEAIRVTKSSGSGNAMTISGGNFEAPTIVKTGGTSSQFLKADGSVDSSTYLTTGSAGSTYVPYSGAAASVNLGVYSITANAINSAGSGSTAGQINLRSDAFFSLVNGYGSIASGTTNQFNFYQTTGAGVFRGAILSLNSITASATRTYTLPDADGTFALSSDLGAYLPLAGGTLTGALSGTSANFTGAVTSQGLLTIGNISSGSNSIIAFANTGNPSPRYLYYKASNGSINVTNDSGIDQFTISDDGNVGIGTSPSALLHLRNGNTEDVSGSIIRMDLSGINPFWEIQARNGVNSANRKLVFFTSSGSTDVMTLTQAGSVGIGTALPVGKFEIASAANTYLGAPAITFTDTAGSGNSNRWIIGNIATDFGSFNIASAPTPSSTTFTPRLTITNSGNVGIGTASPTAKLHLGGFSGVVNQEKGLKLTNDAGTIVALEIGNSSDSYVGTISASNFAIRVSNVVRMTVDSSGNIGAPTGTNIYNASDYRLKQNIETISNGLDKISALNPVKFNWIDGFVPSEDGKDMLGFVAQEVYDVIPEAVESFGGNSILVNDIEIENPLRVNEKFIIPVLVKAIQELKTEIDSLKNQMQ